jgi:hypothetical protein
VAASRARDLARYDGRCRAHRRSACSRARGRDASRGKSAPSTS